MKTEQKMLKQQACEPPSDAEHIFFTRVTAQVKRRYIRSRFGFSKILCLGKVLQKTFSIDICADAVGVQVFCITI